MEYSTGSRVSVTLNTKTFHFFIPKQSFSSVKCFRVLRFLSAVTFVDKGFSGMLYEAL